MAVVVASYRQNVHAYPSGGGDYEVATVNLGPKAGSDGRQRAAGRLRAHRRGVDLLGRAVRRRPRARHPRARGRSSRWSPWSLLTAMNLRGVRESGTASRSRPTCSWSPSSGWPWSGRSARSPATCRRPTARSSRPTSQPAFDGGLVELAGAFLLLRAFSSGCAALTGVEAISNGVPAFKKPKSRNAATTLRAARRARDHHAHVDPAAWPTMRVVYVDEVHPRDDPGRQPADGVGSGTVRFADGTEYHQSPGHRPARRRLFDRFPPAFFVVAAATGLILVLAANTAFNGFPVLGSILAQDGYLPAPAAHPRRPARVQQRHPDPGRRRDRADRRLRRRGHPADPALHRRGVRLLHAQPDRHGPALDPAPAAPRPTPGAGADAALAGDQRASAWCITGTVLVVVLITKFTHGAWIALLAMAVLFVLMRAIRPHYDHVRRRAGAARSTGQARVLPSRVHAIVLVSKMHKPTHAGAGLRPGRRGRRCWRRSPSTSTRRRPQALQERVGGAATSRCR